MVISIALFLFLFGLAFAKTSKVEARKVMRIPATASANPRAE